MRTSIAQRDVARCRVLAGWAASASRPRRGRSRRHGPPGGPPWATVPPRSPGAVGNTAAGPATGAEGPGTGAVAGVGGGTAVGGLGGTIGSANEGGGRVPTPIESITELGILRLPSSVIKVT